jgi:O-antigen ligase
VTRPRDQNFTPSPTHPLNLSRTLTGAAYFLLLTVVLARGLVFETLREPFAVTVNAPPVPRGAGPAAGVVLDWLAMLPAVLVLARRAIDRSYALRAAWSPLPAALLAAWAMLSMLWADDRFAGAVGAFHFVGAVALLWASAQLVRDWLHLRLVAAACFGLMLAIVAHALEYRYVEVPDMRRMIEHDREKILQQRGWEPGSFMEKQFFKNARGGAMVGLHSSPNTLAAVMVMLGVVSAGGAIQRWRDRDARGWLALILIPLPVVAWVILLTQSKAALLTPALALSAIALVGVAGQWLARRRAALLVAGLALALMCTVAVVGYGLQHDHLRNDSLTFRWRYWVGAARLVAERPLLGVGWNNFGTHYLRVRQPIASEEVKDPHNLLVRFTSELGVVGGALALTWIILVAIDMTRTPSPQPSPGGRGGRALPLLFKLVAGAIVLAAVASIDLSQQIEWVFVEVIKRLLFGGAMLLGLIVAAFRSFDRQELDDRPAPWVLVAMVVAAGVFLLHNLIDFSFFEPGPMMLFMLVAGSAIGMTCPQRPARWRGASVAVLAFTAHLFAAGLIVLPVVLAESRTRAGDELLRAGAPAAASRAYLDANDAVSFGNADYVFRAGRAQIIAAAPSDTIRATLERAIASDPSSALYKRTMALHALNQRPPDVTAFQKWFDESLALDPNDVQGRLLYASELEKLGLREEASRHYREALRLNNLLAPDEPKRLSQDTLNQIRSKLQE